MSQIDQPPRGENHLIPDDLDARLAGLWEA